MISLLLRKITWDIKYCIALQSLSAYTSIIMPSTWADFALELRTRFNKNGRRDSRQRQREPDRYHQNQRDVIRRFATEDADGLVRRNQQDKVFYKLHYQLTSITLAFGCILLSCNIYVGNALTCTGQPPAFEFTEDDIDSFCLPNAKGLKPKEDGNGYILNDTTVCWFQWSSLLLLLQGACFYLPNLIWKNFDRSLVNSVIAHLSVTDMTEDSAVYLKNAVLWFSKSKRLHHQYFGMKFLSDLLYLLNVALQCFFLNHLLGGLFMRFVTEPTDTFWLWLRGADPQYQAIFPKKVECTLRFYGPSGNVMNYPLLCQANLNYMNDLIFFLEMIWFTVLLIMTIIALIAKWRFLFCPALIHHTVIEIAGTNGKERAVKLCRTYDNSSLYVLVAIVRKMTPDIAEEFVLELCKTDAKVSPTTRVSIM